MKGAKYQDYVPKYKGKKWLECKLPMEARPWFNGLKYSVRHGVKSPEKVSNRIRRLLSKYKWEWPEKPIYFITDTHADGKAFIASLVACGGIVKTGEKDEDFKLTEQGKEAVFIIGGDCFDKGPSNLRLIRCLSLLRAAGAQLKILAGNHDLRVMYGMRCVGLQGDTGNEHFFIRMGKKGIPFLKEINELYLNKKSSLKGIPSEEICQKLLFPSEDWYDKFPEVASWVMPQNAIDKEISKIRSKSESFAVSLQREGLTMQQAFAATLKWKELFWKEDGEFSWFYEEMKIALKKGSFLFVHAGVDDRVLSIIRDQGTAFLNKQFSKQISSLPFEFYFGPIATTVRTKYRSYDMPFTQKGAKIAHDQGIHAIVHGHKNLQHGQRLSIRKSILNFECDTTMDENSRVKEDVPGLGAGVTAILPEGIVLGISSDYKYIKVFDYKDLTAGKVNA